MKANELRIGNLVFRKSDMFMSEIHSVWPSSIKLWCNPLALFKEEEIEPIPLTEEILLKVGFENNRISVNTSDELAFMFDGQNRELRYQTKSSGFTRSFKTQYLHQLQNLYFSLTGEELKIEL